MPPWYKQVTPRKEVSEGRSFNPDEFAIALEQVVAGTAPDDYKDPTKFFARTVFTRALKDHAASVLRRLAGETEGAPPVLTLVTQFGGGKTHTLTALYHLVEHADAAPSFLGVPEVLHEAGLAAVPPAQVWAFVGNAWDPAPGRETPWLDFARSVAGDAGVEALGPSAATAAPGTTALGRLFEAAGGSVLVLCDEVLNFVNRHRSLADGFYAFVQNLTVAMTGTTRCAAMISLPRSQVEMTARDVEWQERITKVVRRVSKDLIVNDEAEIAEVVRRRLFEDLGNDWTRKQVAAEYADWCFERRAQLPPEWTAGSSEKNAREYLQGRFAACYPFHPATLSVFQRKWQVLPQYQQTRGTLAMLAQWVSCALRDSYRQRRRSESLITLGSAPLDVPEFRSVVLGQLGEARLGPAIEADIAGPQAHARALDADTKDSLADIHQRVGAAILFESSGGQRERIAHLPELRFALGEPNLDTTSVDSAAVALESRAFFIRRLGSDGFQIRYQATLKKVVADRRASLDWESEVKPTLHELVRKEFERGAPTMPLFFPEESSAVPDTPRLNLVVLDPGAEWNGRDGLAERIGEWARQRGSSPRLYPGALVWCLKKPGRELREKIETWLAWKRTAKDAAEGTLGTEFGVEDRADITASVRTAESEAKDEVWAGYRYVLVLDSAEPNGLKAIDLGAGHASAAESLYNRIITALKSQSLLNETVGAGYIERHWPEALKASGAWPLTGLRQSFLNGALTRLLDTDAVLRRQIPDFVARGEFALASGPRPDGTYDRIWFNQPVESADVVFEPGLFLLTKAKAAELVRPSEPPKPSEKGRNGGGEPEEKKGGEGQEPPRKTDGEDEESRPTLVALRLAGPIPPEVWNRVGTKLIPKLRSANDLQVGVEFRLTVEAGQAMNLIADLQQALDDLGIAGSVRIEKG